VKLPAGIGVSQAVTAGGRTDRRAEIAERFEAFVREYQHMVFATAVRLLGNAAEAEDVAQTVFLRAFERFETIGRSATAAGWLKAVATNLALNHLSRYRARWQFFSEMERPGDEAGGRAEALATTDSPLAELERADRAERVERALQALPDHQRVPLVLFHFDGMSYEAIASALGVSVGKVKTDIHRGRARLRTALAVLDESR